jgi:hypothetical protein
MIQFTKSYKTGDGQVFGSIEEAQIHELMLALDHVLDIDDIKTIMTKKNLVVDILTTTPNSKPKARSLNGGTKKRKTVVTDAPASVTSTNNS